MTEIDPKAEPSGIGCVECLASGGWWLHLRRCAACGHIGCCDNSPSQHARKHVQESDHPIIASFEPGEDWFYDFRSDQMFSGGPLAPPRGCTRLHVFPPSVERHTPDGSVPPAEKSVPCLPLCSDHRPPARDPQRRYGGATDRPLAPLSSCSTRPCRRCPIHE